MSAPNRQDQLVVPLNSRTPRLQALAQAVWDLPLRLLEPEVSKYWGVKLGVRVAVLGGAGALLTILGLEAASKAHANNALMNVLTGTALVEMGAANVGLVLYLQALVRDFPRFVLDAVRQAKSDIRQIREDRDSLEP